MATIAIGVLGPLVVAGAELPAARQQRVVLAALTAVAPDRVSAEELIEGLWPQQRPADAGKALQVLVARLRRCLAPGGVEVALRSGGYFLAIDPDRIDVVVFRRLCEQERALSADQLAERRDVLERALALWRGEPYEGLGYEPLIAGPAIELCLRRDEVIARYQELRLEWGEADGLIPELTSWARDHPLDEGAWCRLALALHRTGRPTEALRALHAHRRAVRDTAGLEPTSVVAELEARLLADDARSPDVSRPGNLRVPTRSFLGRSGDVRTLTARLSPEVVTTLVGAPGIGKTTLALHLAGGVRHRYRDGVWWCELSDIASGEAIVASLADALGVRQQRGQSLLASIVSGFRDAEALLVLDNCEHVRTSASEVIRELQRDCPKLTLLATSREPIDLDRERVYPVEPLPVPDSDEHATRSSAFQLFVDRASESGAAVELDTSTSAAVVEICRRLDGLPLAIELAAARARTMSVVEMSKRLDERFRILARDRIAGARHQQTLWDAVDWSFQLLEDVHQRLFMQLSVFLGGFTIEAAAAVAGRPVPEVEETVWSLAERSLLSPVPAGEGTRYQMLETLRQYGFEQLKRAGLADQTRDAHLRYFVDFAHGAADGIRGSDEVHQVKRVTGDLANLRASYQHAAASRLVDSAATMVAALHEFAEWRQFFELGAWARTTLDLDVVERTYLAPVLHAVAGWGRCIAGDFGAAMEHANQGLAAELRGGIECGWLHDVLAHCAFFQGDVEGGLAHSNREIERARAAVDSYRLGYVLADSGTHASLQGETQLGLERAEEALALAEQIDNPSAISMAQLAHGFAYRDRDPIRAIEWFRRAADLADTVDSTWTNGICRGELTLLLALHGDPHEALEMGLAQFSQFRRAGDAARTRGLVRMAIPALHQLLEHDDWTDLVALEAGTADRPHIREPFNDQAIDRVISRITDHIGKVALAEGTSRGIGMDDRAVFDLGQRLMQAATGQQSQTAISRERPCPGADESPTLTPPLSVVSRPTGRTDGRSPA